MKRVLLVLILLVAGNAAAGVRYTIPFGVFSYDYNPAEPREDYLHGNLGVVVPSYSRSYLYVAHRWMDGAPITSEEQQQIQKTWFSVPELPENQENAWRDLRSATGVPIPDFVKYARPGPFHLDTRDYVQYFPCTPHAYQRAADRLRQHLDRFGAASAEVRHWVQAQDLVFHNCSDERTVPPEAPPSIHPVIRDDRRYQFAAARFIAADFEDAEASFRRIGHAPKNWAGLWAPYMVGRSILWQARTEVTDERNYRRLLRKAQLAFEAVLQDDELAATHNAARFLLIRILAISDQEAAARLLGLRLMSPLRVDSRVQDLNQYLSLLYHNTRRKVAYRMEMKPHAELRELGERDALTDWILAFQSKDTASYEYSLERWRATGTTAWLVSCLSKADGGSAAAVVLLAAAAEEPKGPGWASIQYYRASLLTFRGEREQARAVLDRLLPEISSRSSSWNRALALRSQLGRTPDEMFHYGIRSPASFGTTWPRRTAPWEWSDWEEQRFGRLLRRGELLFPEVADILDSAVPLARFADLAKGATRLPEPIRQDLIIAAWVRAVLLDDQRLAVPLSFEVSELVPTTEADMIRFRAAAPGERQFVAAGIMLKFPGMSARVHPGTGRHSPLHEVHTAGFNWWWWTERGGIYPMPPKAGPVGWLTTAERSQAEEEWARIMALGSGAAWLYGTVMGKCTGASPPPGCAEALYRTVVSEEWIDYHHGIQHLPYEIESSVRYEAAKLLEQRFANTTWAQADRTRPPKDEFCDYRLSAPYPR